MSPKNVFPANLSLASRQDKLARLAQGTFDVLVVGGGATGAATARDAALRGLRTALVDYGDFASQTSSASSRLIHGGIRYLQYGNFGLVFEGLAERRRLMAAAPHLCRPVDFLFPAYKGAKPGLGTIGVGIRLYNLLALGRPPSTRVRLSADQVKQAAPLLQQDGLAGAQIYQDCQTDDARLVLENILDAEAAGAVCINHAHAAWPQHVGRAFCVAIADRMSPNAPGITIQTRAVVNATGPFSDAFTGTHHLRPTLGVHLVIDDARLPTRGRVFVLNAPQDGRLFFVMPSGGRTVVGTTDTDWRPGGPPAHPRDEIRATASDVRYLLAAANHAFPTAALVPADVISTWAGLRPLVKSLDDSPSATSREHEIFFDQGLVTIVGGKLTTMRKMAEQIVDKVCVWGKRRGLSTVPGPCLTQRRPLPGGGTWPDASAWPLPEATSKHLLARYGARAQEVADLISASPDLAKPITPELWDVWGEVVFAVRQEHAHTIEDVLRRRLSVFRNARDQGLAAAPRVADILAAELQVPPEQKRQWQIDYERAVASTRRWQAET